MVHSHPVVDSDKHFIIDPITRAVTNAESKKTMLMQNDHNSERFSFEIDKVIEGHDMTLCNQVEVHYSNLDTTKKNKSLGVYEVDDIQVSSDDPTKLVFTWLVSQNATVHAGTLSFLVIFSCVENGDTTYRWNSNLNSSITIARGLNNGEFVEESYPDILNQWKSDLYAAIYGMETVSVGPTEPETYPYIWFDTSNFFGDPENIIGQLTIKDVDGDKTILHPYAILKGTDGANIDSKLDELLEQLDAFEKTFNEGTTERNNELKELSDNAVLRSNIADNLETVEKGRVLDASQGAILKQALETAVNRLDEDKAETAMYTATFPASGWSDTVPYTQTVACDGVLSTDNPIVDLDMADVVDSEVAEARSVTWSMIGRIVVLEDGELTAYCYLDKPETDFSIIVKVVR